LDNPPWRVGHRRKRQAVVLLQIGMRGRECRVCAPHAPNVPIG